MKIMKMKMKMKMKKQKVKKEENEDYEIKDENEDYENKDEDDETIDQNEIIKGKYDDLDKIIDKSKSFEDQIKSLKKLESLKGY